MPQDLSSHYHRRRHSTFMAVKGPRINGKMLDKDRKSGLVLSARFRAFCFDVVIAKSG